MVCADLGWEDRLTHSVCGSDGSGSDASTFTDFIFFRVSADFPFLFPRTFRFVLFDASSYSESVGGLEISPVLQLPSESERGDSRRRFAMTVSWVYSLVGLLD